MKLETLKRKFPFAKESYAEKIIKIVENKIGTDVEFVSSKMKEDFRYKYEDVFTTSYTYQDDNSDGLHVSYSFLETEIKSYRGPFGKSCQIKFQIIIVYPTGESICIECDKSLFANRNEVEFDKFTIEVVKFVNGVRDDLWYFPADEQGNIKVIYDCRAGESMIVSVDDVLGAIENGNWEQIFNCSFKTQNLARKI